MDYWALASAELTCRSCGWMGSGSLATVGELFEQLAEYCCPECGKKIVVVQFPTRSETAAAASRGNAEAIVAMGQWAQRDIFWSRLEESQRAPIEWPAWLNSGDVACTLHLDDAGGDTWMVLTANGLEIHREIAAYESPEPLARLGAAVKQQVGERLKAFDYAPAMLYLAGDKLRLIGELEQTASQLLGNST